MIPRPPSSSPSIQPILRKSSGGVHQHDKQDNKQQSSLDKLSSSLHSCDYTASLSSLGGSLHSCPDFPDDKKYVVISRRPKIHKIATLQEYTAQEVLDCWWDAEELTDIRKQCKAVAKNSDSADDLRGLETFTNRTRKRAVVEMARETVLFDKCLMNYALNAKVSLKEAQTRAQQDAAAVDRTELAVLMKELTLSIPSPTQSPTTAALLATTKKSRSKTNLFQEMGARMQRRVKTARGA